MAGMSLSMPEPDRPKAAPLATIEDPSIKRKLVCRCTGLSANGEAYLCTHPRWAAL